MKSSTNNQLKKKLNNQKIKWKFQNSLYFKVCLMGVKLQLKQISIQKIKPL